MFLTQNVSRWLNLTTEVMTSVIKVMTCVTEVMTCVMKVLTSVTQVCLSVTEVMTCVKQVRWFVTEVGTSGRAWVSHESSILGQGRAHPTWPESAGKNNSPPATRPSCAQGHY